MANPFDDIFGTPGPQWTTDQITARIRGEATKQGVDPDVALAVARQESALDPYARGDNGQAIGLFQLHEGAAKDAGIDPRWRDDPSLNIYGGVRYLKMKLDQSKGNVDEALSRYNRGTPDYQGIGDPNYVQNVKRFLPGAHPERQQPGMLARVAGVFSPASAEAATPPQGAPSAMWDDIFGPQQPVSATTVPAPTPPTATSTPEQDAAYRASRGQQGAGQGPPVLRLSMGDPTEAASEAEAAATIARFRASQAGAPGLQPPPDDRSVLAVGGGPSRQAQAVTDPAALLAVGGRPQAASTNLDPQARVREELAAWEKQAGRPWREGDPRMPSEKRLGVPDEAPVEEGITRPSTMIPLLMPGAGIKAVTPLLKQAGPLITRGARAAAEGLSQTFGWTAGRTAETGQVPSPGEIGTEAAWNIGTGGVIEGLGAARRGMIRGSRGGQAVQQEGQAVVPEAYQQAVEGQRSAIQTARAVPGRYSPETPSWTLYERFGDAAKNQEVDLLTAKTALADVRAGRGVLPDGSMRPFPQAVERIATSLEQAADTASVQTIRQELRRLGPLTRHADGNIRGPAKQLYGIYADAMEHSPAANDLLRQANATFRKEMALQDVQEWLRPGHGVIRIDNQGREVINVGSLLTRLEKKIGDDTLFARSFGPEELQRLRQDFGTVAGTPSMPRGGPPALQTAREAIGERPRFLPTGRGLGSLGGLEYLATSLGVPPGVVTAVKAGSAVTGQARYGLAYALTSARLRPLVLRAIHENGTINPRVYGLIIAAMTPAEKKALERETRGKR